MRFHHYSGILLFGLSLCLVASLVPFPAQAYTLTDLGVGDAFKAAGPNSVGHAAVRSGFATARSSRRGPDIPADSLGLLLNGGDHTTANAINDSGVIVGSANARFNVRPVIWMRNSGLVDLGALPGDSAGEAFGINNSGDVVGYSSGSSGKRAFLWTRQSGMQALRTLPGGDSSEALAISDTALIVGSSGSPVGPRAVLWNLGIPQDLGTLPGDVSSEAVAVNNAGKVVGFSTGAGGMRAFLWTRQDGMQSLGSLPGGNVTRAMGINEQGAVVGISGSARGTRAVLWNAQREPMDLNTLVPVPDGVILSEAVGINAKGQILVLARNQKDPHGLHEGYNRVFLLTP